MADFDLAIVGGGINGDGDRARRRRPRTARAAGRAERPRVRHLVGLHQAHPWRAALSRARLASAGARGADRARGDAAHGAAPDPADALRAAAGAGAAPGLDAAPRPVHLRPSRRPQNPARDPHASTLADDPLGAPLKRRLPARLRIFRLLGGRCAPRRAQRRRCRRARRRDPHPHALHRASSAATIWRLVLEARGRRDIATARVLVNATGPWARAVRRRRAARARRRRSGSTRAATSWCGACSSTIAATFSRRSDRPRRVRAAVRARFHPDRNHRSGLHRRSRRRQARRRRDRLSLRARPTQYFRKAIGAGRRGVVVCRRALAL